MISRTAAPHTAPRTSRLAIAGFALTAALGLSACQMTSPVTTDMIYDPADGVSVNVGDVAVRDLLVVSEGNGAPGVVSGLVVNDSSEPTEVTLLISADGQAMPLAPTVSVPAGAAVRLDGQGAEGSTNSGQGAVNIPNVAAAPGGNVEILVQTSNGQADSGLAPVLLPEGYYSDLVSSTADVSN